MSYKSTTWPPTQLSHFHSGGPLGDTWALKSQHAHPRHADFVKRPKIIAPPSILKHSKQLEYVHIAVPINRNPSFFQSPGLCASYGIRGCPGIRSGLPWIPWISRVTGHGFLASMDSVAYGPGFHGFHACHAFQLVILRIPWLS